MTLSRTVAKRTKEGYSYAFAPHQTGWLVLGLFMQNELYS
jgi:hypothetical protein